MVAGVARGRRLVAPAGSDTRPTSDRVREAMFSMLVSMDAVEGADVLDLFAGSGALGIEALSRGAATAVLVDSSPAAAAAMRVNSRVLGPLEDRASVVRSDVLEYLDRAPAVDLVFADPPYDFAGWPLLLDRLQGRAGLLVAETAVRWEPGPRWETVKVKLYGGTVVTILQPVSDATSPAKQEGET